MCSSSTFKDKFSIKGILSMRLKAFIAILRNGKISQIYRENLICTLPTYSMLKTDGNQN